MAKVGLALSSQELVEAVMQVPADVQQAAVEETAPREAKAGLR